MIVQCTSCRARFRVADEKVPDRGVKVRCTKCSTVFRVTKADAVDARTPATRDPFGLETGNTPANGQHAANPFEPDHMTGPVVQTGSHPREQTGTPAPPRLANFPQSVSLTYGAASPHQTLDLELSLGPAQTTAAKPTMPAIPVPPSLIPPSMPMASSDSNAIDAALTAALGSADPFSTANFGVMPPPPPPQMPSRGYAALAPVDPFADEHQAPSYPASSPSAATVSFDDPFSVDFGSAPAGQAQQFRAPPPPPADPFAMDYGGNQQTYPAGPAYPPPQPAYQAQSQPQPAYQAPPPPTPPQQRGGDPWANLIGQPKKEETDPFAGLDNQPASEPPPREQQRAAAPVSSISDEPFGEQQSEDKPPPSTGLKSTGVGEFELGENTRGHKIDLDYGPLGSAPYEQPEPPRASRKDPPPSKESSKEVVEIGRIQLGRPDDPNAEEKLKAIDQKAAARSRLRRELASAVFNVTCACVVFYSGIVAVAWLRAPRPIGFDDLGFPMVWLALGADSKDPGEQLHAAQVKSGIYPTRAGGELFYVEGNALNSSAVKHDALYAEVEVVRGDRVVERTEALAQLRATPENLWELDSRKNDDLQRALVKSSPSLEVESNGSAPFLAVFKLTARDVEGCDVRVTIHPGIPASLRAMVSGAPKDAQEPPKDAPEPPKDAPEPPKDPDAPRAQRE